MASSLENTLARPRALCFVLLGVGCTATTLDIPQTSPGYPGHPTTELPRSRALDPGFEPAAPTETRPPASAPPSSAVVYQCPMHPEVERDAPGRCPICGMKLEQHSSDHQMEQPSH